METHRTGQEWAKILGARILDHDGWRTANPFGPCDFFKDRITKDEFDKRLGSCTIDFRSYPHFVEV